MNKEEILKKIKDEVASETGAIEWGNHPINPAVDEVARRYAIAMCNLQMQECEKSAKIESYFSGKVEVVKHIQRHHGGEIETISINRQSILNAKNIGE